MAAALRVRHIVVACTNGLVALTCRFVMLSLYGLFNGIHVVDGIDFSRRTEVVMCRGTRQALVAAQLHAVEWWISPYA